MLKKILPFALSFIVLLNAFSVISFAANDDMDFGRSILKKMNNSDALLYAYDTILNGIEKSSDNISIEHKSHKLTVDEANTVNIMILHDHPELFWVGKNFSVNSINGVAVEILPTYTISGSSLSAAKESLNSKADSILSGLSGKSEYEISLAVHDRLCEAVSYEYAGHHQTAYGALVEGKAVCAGYARAYQYLMKKMGIPVWYITGQSVNPSTKRKEAHGWNMVKIDGEWYYTDVTWDDQSTLYHAYFNITSAYINEGHEPDELIASYLPNATSTKANYFIKKGLNVSSFDTDSVTELFKNTGSDFKKPTTITLFVTGNITDYENSFKSNAKAIATALGITGGYSHTTAELGRELHITLFEYDSGHKHSLTKVAKKAPTCLVSGNSEYYTCSCGKCFLDSAAENEITDSDTVFLKPIDHKPSGWKSDTVKHWKECTSCKSLINDTSASHKDANKDIICDVCSASVGGSNTASKPISTESEAVVSDTVSDLSSPDTEDNDTAPPSSIYSSTSSSKASVDDINSAFTEIIEDSGMSEKEFIIVIIAGTAILLAVMILVGVLATRNSKSKAPKKPDENEENK